MSDQISGGGALGPDARLIAQMSATIAACSDNVTIEQSHDWAVDLWHRANAWQAGMTYDEWMTAYKQMEADNAGDGENN